MRKSRYTNEDPVLERFVHELRRAILAEGSPHPSMEPGCHLELREAFAAVCRKVKRNSRGRAPKP